MRWADLDMLGHVNNVTYLNYLREARIDFFAALGRRIDVDDLDEGIRILRNQVVFAAPLLFRQQPVTIELWTSDIGIDTFALNYEIFDETPRGRTVYLRVRAEVQLWVVATGAPRALSEPERGQLAAYEGPSLEFSALPDLLDAASLPAAYELTVRLSDLDIYRRVSDVVYFEYFQEARVAYLYEIASRASQSSALVVARTDITYLEPVRLRRDPYLVRSGVARLGTTSFTVVGQILDGDVVVATAQVVLVGFDPQRQVAAPLAESQRDVLRAEFEAAVAT